MQYGGVEKRPAFERYWERVSDRDAKRRADEIDNDGDGFVDYPADPGCETPGDRDETDPDVLHQVVELVHAEGTVR